jgi:hypothetical protein
VGVRVYKAGADNFAAGVNGFISTKVSSQVGRRTNGDNLAVGDCYRAIGKQANIAHRLASFGTVRAGAGDKLGGGMDE